MRVNGEPNRLAILEALLFVAEAPLSLSKLQEVLADAEVAATEESLRAGDLGHHCISPTHHPCGS